MRLLTLIAEDPLVGHLLTAIRFSEGLWSCFRNYLVKHGGEHDGPPGDKEHPSELPGGEAAPADEGVGWVKGEGRGSHPVHGLPPLVSSVGPSLNTATL